ncbi:methionine adenosyltransferase [Bengtsoniella intestinalis]|uniref:methionine adenosyltransferase n=1 Tax=Bengtsoniella intestinalis TaxID=3073143 RepID=UPI00391F9A03
MRDNYILTAESVTEGHPDKLCDTISDSVLDACLQSDPHARVACETLATAGKIVVAGEITTKELPDIPAIISKTVCETGYGAVQYEIEVLTHNQSRDIAGAVSKRNETGAGDQGIMYGYACNETAELLPLPVVLAHRLTKALTLSRVHGYIDGLRPDGKAQVSVEYHGDQPVRVSAIVLSCQHDEDVDFHELCNTLREDVIEPSIWEVPMDARTQILINPSGRFVEGGFEADTGLTGRKLMVDTYGGLAPHGGGALSGKDGTKVDRSGAYMARYIAKNLVAGRLADRCTVTLAYAIGKAEPVAVDIDTHGTGKYSEHLLERAVRALFDLTPDGMMETLKLDHPIFAQFCNYGHFTHEDAPWEQTDLGILWLNIASKKSVAPLDGKEWCA